MSDTTRKCDRKESVDFLYMPQLGGNEKIKEGKGLLQTKLPILLVWTKVGNNSCKLRNKIRQILYLLYQHNKTSKTLTTI